MPSRFTASLACVSAWLRVLPRCTEHRLKPRNNSFTATAGSTNSRMVQTPCRVFVVARNHFLCSWRYRSRVTDKQEVIGSSVGLVPTNAHVCTDSGVESLLSVAY